MHFDQEKCMQAYLENVRPGLRSVSVHQIWMAAWQAATEQASQSQDELIANMAMLMRRLLYSPDNKLLQSKVREFLKRNNLDGSPLRESAIK